MVAKVKLDAFEILVQKYLGKLHEIAQHPDASDELSFRPALNILLEGLSEALDKKEMSIITEPLRKAYGTPDYKIKTGKDFVIGYIEAKGLSSNVQELTDSEQIERYCASGQRLVLTNHLEFVLFDFVSGEKESPVMRVDQVKLLDKKGLLSEKKPHPADIDTLRKLFDRFLREARPEIDGARGLAKRMANIAHIIRDSIGYAFENDKASKTLQDLHKAFQEILIPDLKTHLSPNEKGKGVITTFDDMYAQTIVYGLFAARCNHDERRGPFTRRLAAYDLPKTNPFLKKLFEQIAGPDIEDEPFCWAVDDLAHLLATVDMEAVLHDFGKRTQREDPVVHFYETFLKEYDPKLREARGVYYTPEAVVSYIVRSVDYLLKTNFNRPKGLVDENTLVLDPACGTGTFLYTVIDHIRNQFKDNKGKWSGYVEKHILSRLFGLELLMAPYAVAHMKLGLQLAGADMPEEVRNDWKYDFSRNERLGIFLTNTLEEAFKKSEKIFASWISDEAEAAARVKRELPIMVVLGNPPYSNYGMMNKGKWIRNLLKDYKYGLDEKKLNLDDDYIKFIRFAHWRIERTGQGILAFITNHTYIDGITHRQMRKALMSAFNEIYILNLHGNSKKKEKCPNGSKDENVFDIQQGVSIGIFVKEPANKNIAKVYHVDLWGLRRDKYAWLFENDIASTKWETLEPQSEHYFFVKKDFSLSSEYHKLNSLTTIFKTFGNGIATDRDNLFYDFDHNILEERIKVFYSSLGILPPFSEDYGVEDSSSYKLISRRSKTKFNSQNIYKCLYRPFDIRWLYYDPKLTSRPAADIAVHLKKTNLSLLITRQISTEKFRHVFVSKYPTDRDPLSLATKERTQIFPLYIYPNNKGEENGQGNMLDTLPQNRIPNLSPSFLSELERKYGLKFLSEQGDLQKTLGSENIFFYIYAILHSPTYRTRYAEFLKIDFPRVPLTADLALFKILIQKGAKLVSLHILEYPILNDTSLQPNYPVKGNDVVGTVSYKEPGEQIPGKSEPLAKGRVYINKTQYFESIEPEVWNFHIGGYQICQKWHKDRKGRKLSYDDKTHYQKMVVAVRETIKLMNEIDEAIPEWPIK